MPRGFRRSPPEPDWVPFTRHARRLLGGARAGRRPAALAVPGVTALLEALALAPARRSLFGEAVVPGERPRCLEIEGTAVDDPARGRLLVLVLHDVTQHHARSAELEARATTDPLTGLANHAVFHDRLRQLTRAERPGWLAVLDLDHFKRVNDRHGHAAGDAILAEVGRRMRAVAPEESGATVARVGGEEFGILLPGLSGADARSLAHGLLDALRAPHPVGGVVTASAGLAEIVRAAAAGTGTRASSSSAEQADRALYAAKASGRDRLVVHGPDLEAARTAVDARLAALERENALLGRLARTDELTGVANRRRFDEDLLAMAASSARRGAPFGVAFIDLDEFGLVNKEWGEIRGDRTLEGAAHAIAGALRAGDAVYRYGGEEFVALLPDADRAGALGVCERIRRALAARAVPHPTRGVVTASMGAASSADHGPEPAAVLRAAVTAMRTAKGEGRDRIVAR